MYMVRTLPPIALGKIVPLWGRPKRTSAETGEEVRSNADTGRGVKDLADVLKMELFSIVSPCFADTPGG